MAALADSLIKQASALTTRVDTSFGESFFIGPALPTDARILGDYFISLSPATRELFAPHEFSHAYAGKLCATLDYSRLIPMIATDRDRTRIAAYFLLYLFVHDGEIRRYAGYGITLDNDWDCMCAPSVRDDFQGKGLARALVEPFKSAARSLGRRRMILLSGTQARNTRAQRFYEKAGFREVGRFPEDGFNVDMVTDLTGPAIRLKEDAQ